MALAADAVTERLVNIALSKRMKDSDVISAAKDLLDRAGVRPDRADTAARPDGTVFWEEFVQIHRRMTAGTTAETTTTDDADATGKAIS